jgi:type II secretory pathway component PulM
MVIQRRHVLTLGAWVAGLALLWALWPAWTLWRSHEEQLQQLSRLRQHMQLAQQEAQALQKKTLPGTMEAQSQIQSITKQRFGATAVSMADSSYQVRLNGVQAQVLAQGWSEIRSQTSAQVTQADLRWGPQGWSGTMTFKLAQKP